MPAIARSLTASLKACSIALGLVFLVGTHGAEALLLALDGPFQAIGAGMGTANSDTEEEREGKEKEDDVKGDRRQLMLCADHPAPSGAGGSPTEAGDLLSGHRPVLLRPPLA